jgi:hypothetical protein
MKGCGIVTEASIENPLRHVRVKIKKVRSYWLKVEVNRHSKFVDNIQHPRKMLGLGLDVTLQHSLFAQAQAGDSFIVKPEN